MKIRFTLAILLGWLLLGPVAPASAAAGDVPPRPLTEQGLTNLTALTRLIGYVRFFHPSDQAAGLTNADWDALAMAGVERVEAARNPGELAAALSPLFDGIAPTVQVLPFPLHAESAVERSQVAGHGGAVRWLAWRHEGVDLHAAFTSYTSERVEIGRAPDGASAHVFQDLDVERLRGHRVRLSAAVRFTAGTAGSAALNLHASTVSGSGSAAWSQPISRDGRDGRGGWQRVEIDAQLPGNANGLTLSFDLTGAGRLTFDDVRATADGLDVTGQLINPGMEEVVPGLPPRGWLLSHTPFGAEYSLSRVTGAAAGRWAAELAGPHVRPVGLPFVADLGGGVSALVPMALPADDQGTFPHLPQPAAPVPDKPAGFVPSGFDRTTRLAGVVVGWGVFQHFYPYFEQVGADWPGALRRALTSAAVDADEASYARTLRRLVVELEDGHARVLPVTLPVRFAFTWDWIEDQLVITSVEAGATHGMVAGDRILAIDGRPAAAELAELESLTSAATPQSRRVKALIELAAGLPGGTATLTVQPHAGGPVRTVTAAYTAPVGSSFGIGGLGSPEEPRPEKIAQVRPGIFYVDLSRIDDDDFNGAVDQLAAADGVVFDMRGYPWFVSEKVLSHLIDKPVTSNWFNLPIITRPDRQGWDWRPAYWLQTPLAPRLTGRIAFLIDGRVLSYAESLMGIVEAERLGALVGGPTGGTNGGADPFPVAGGHTLRFTGMDVRKKDGSPHHGVGIHPTVPVGRTLAGVIAGRDEVLEKGIEVVSQP
ncbi:MAG TPA: S41 family peptidase [Thermoanaerobaculia bacterium]|jgi:C-terminal processing protease CtpA/Prc|nr:S41 family peptidase [Thermoanaerobaculia bacterium]